jgi:hypothetical protein
MGGAKPSPASLGARGAATESVTLGDGYKREAPIQASPMRADATDEVEMPAKATILLLDRRTRAESPLRQAEAEAVREAVSVV